LSPYIPHENYILPEKRGSISGHCFLLVVMDKMEKTITVIMSLGCSQVKHSPPLRADYRDICNQMPIKNSKAKVREYLLLVQPIKMEAAEGTKEFLRT
jgi:hypothetical protein